MPLQAWVRRFGGWASKKIIRQSQSRRQRPRRWQPVVEGLEDRLVPTTLSIPTNLTAVQGSVVTVPINVDILQDDANGNIGFGAATFIVNYNASAMSVSASDVKLGTLSTGGSTALGDGYTPTSPNHMETLANANSQGHLIFIVFSDGLGVVTGAATGSIVTIDFHIKPNASVGPTSIDLAADNLGSVPFTSMADFDGNYYILDPAPQDGPDPTDGLITITPSNHNPVASDDAITTDEDTVAAGNVLANDHDADAGDMLTVS